MTTALNAILSVLILIQLGWGLLVYHSAVESLTALENKWEVVAKKLSGLYGFPSIQQGTRDIMISANFTYMPIQDMLVLQSQPLLIAALTSMLIVQIKKQISIT